jgi:hypothetical protein
MSRSFALRPCDGGSPHPQGRWGEIVAVVEAAGQGPAVVAKPFLHVEHWRQQPPQGEGLAGL